MSWLYRRRKQYIVAKAVDAVDVPPGVAASGDAECVLFESVAALREGRVEMPPSLRDSFEDLEGRLEEGCLVFLATRSPGLESEKNVVGYCICERGVFSALGRKRILAADIMFTHYIEVTPEYRGRGLADMIRHEIEEHCRANGINVRCSVIAPSKIPSLKSSLRAGFKIVGSITHVSAFNGLLVWNTPWKRIEKILKKR